MELDELKEIWQDQESGDPIHHPEREIREYIDDRMRSLEEQIRSRDRLEIVAAVVVMIIFGFLFFYTSSFWTRAGAGIVVLSAIYICYRLKKAQIEQVNSDQSFDRSVEAHLEMELQQVQTQKKLLQSVAWWYIAPMTVGLILLTFDSGSGFWFRILYPALLIVFGVIIWKFNQRTVKRKFDPLEADIREAIRFIENGNQQSG